MALCLIPKSLHAWHFTRGGDCEDAPTALQNIPFPLSGEPGAVAAYKDKVEALRAQVGARTVEEEVRDGLAAASLRPKTLEELEEALDSDEPALQPAQDAYEVWEEEVSAWLTAFEKRYGSVIPSDAATEAAEAEVDWSGKATSKRRELHPAEIEFWTKAKEFQVKLGRIADLIPYDPAAATVQPSDAEVKRAVLSEYQTLVDEARAAVAEDLAKADSITQSGEAALPAEVKPKLD